MALAAMEVEHIMAITEGITAIMEEGITAIREEDITGIMGTASVIAGDIMDLVEELMVAPVVAVSAIKVTGVMAVDTTIPIERNTIAILIRFLE
eukprot:XP_019081771.1 PREDICTED: uncharacterized protein LOC100256282 isoform X3 [Vitis vinifera]